MTEAEEIDSASVADAPAQPIRIFIVDDHEVVREGLLASFRDDPSLLVVGTAGTAREAIEHPSVASAHVCLVDLRLPDLPGDRLCAELRQRHPGVNVVILTTFLNEGTVSGALNAGAVEYVTKSAGLGELRSAIHRAAATCVGAAPSDSRQRVRQLESLLSARSNESLLTPQQQAVIDLAARGMTDAEIGAHMYISRSTVRFHLGNLKVKLGARSKADLVARAIRSGLADASSDEGQDGALSRA